MKLVTIKFERTEHHRVATCGGMDSEYSHSSVEQKEMAVVVPSEHDIDQALAYCDRWAGNGADPAYKRHGHVVTNVTAIIESPRTRL